MIWIRKTNYVLMIWKISIEISNRVLYTIGLMDTIRFYPRFARELGEDAHQWLSGLNAMIQGQGLVVDTAKGILVNRDVLDLPESVRASAQALLLAHYGLPVEDQNPTSQIEETRDILAAIELERFGLNPREAIVEFNRINWIGLLQNYSRYSVTAVPRFRTLTEGCKGSVVLKKADILAREAEAKRDTILGIDKGDWEEARAGVKWSQTGFAQDRHREEMEIVGEYRNVAISVDHLYSVGRDRLEEVLRDVFGPLETSVQLDNNTDLTPLNYFQITLGKDMGRGVNLHIGNVLVPKTQINESAILLIES